MAVGLYGSTKLADVTIDDVDILFAYSPSREEVGDIELKPLYNSITNSPEINIGVGIKIF